MNSACRWTGRSFVYPSITISNVGTRSPPPPVLRYIEYVLWFHSNRPANLLQEEEEEAKISAFRFVLFEFNCGIKRLDAFSLLSFIIYRHRILAFLLQNLIPMLCLAPDIQNRCHEWSWSAIIEPCWVLQHFDGSCNWTWISVITWLKI